MPEPTSSGVAGAAVAYKAFGGTAAAVASGATLAAVVVMLMTPPRDKREWVYLYLLCVGEVVPPVLAG